MSKSTGALDRIERLHEPVDVVYHVPADVLDGLKADYQRAVDAGYAGSLAEYVGTHTKIRSETVRSDAVNVDG